jgi:hypothetical protein
MVNIINFILILSVNKLSKQMKGETLF